MAGPDRALGLFDFFAELRDHAFHVLPVEADGGGLLLDPIRLEEGRQPFGAPSEDRFVSRLTAFALFPLPQDPLGVEVAALAEYVRVPRDHLHNNLANQLRGLRALLPLERDREEYDEEQEITQLLAGRGAVAARDRLSYLVRFLDQIGGERLRRLLAIPRATLRARKVAYQIEQLRGGRREFLSVGGRRGIRVNRAHARSVVARSAGVHCTPAASPERHRVRRPPRASGCLRRRAPCGTRDTPESRRHLWNFLPGPK